MAGPRGVSRAARRLCALKTPSASGFLTTFALALCLAAPARAAQPAQGGRPYAELDPARIAAMESLLPETPRGFGAPCSDREAWRPLAANPAFQKAVTVAAAQLGKGLPPWSDDLYLDFSRTGKRPPGEKMISSRHTLLRQLVWAECVENQGRFMPDIEKMFPETRPDLSVRPPRRQPHRHRRLRIHPSVGL